LGKLKEPHEKVRRAACGSRAAVWPPLLYLVTAAGTALFINYRTEQNAD